MWEYKRLHIAKATLSKKMNEKGMNQVIEQSHNKCTALSQQQTHTTTGMEERAQIQVTLHLPLIVYRDAEITH